MKLREWAMRMGISEDTAMRRYKAGKIAGAKVKNGQVWVPDHAVPEPMMKLSAWADLMGISYRTAWLKFKRGEIKGAFKLGGKTILVPKPETCLQMGLQYEKIELGPETDYAAINAIYVILALTPKEEVVGTIKSVAAILKVNIAELDKLMRLWESRYGLVGKWW